MNVLAVTFGTCSVILSYALVRVSLRLKTKAQEIKKVRQQASVSRKMQIMSEVEKEHMQKRLGFQNVFEPDFGNVEVYHE